MCDCGGINIENRCNLCDKILEEEIDMKIFDEIGATELTPHNEISLSIRNTAANMFSEIVKNNIKRGSPRIGLGGACIHLASIHWNYPITITEISKKIGKQSHYITSELKILRKWIDGQGLDYDIIITDEKYINRYYLDLKLNYNISELQKEKVLEIINHMNNNDILINYHANTRICCVFYHVLQLDCNSHVLQSNYKDIYSVVQNISIKDYCKICNISRNTFTKFISAFNEHKDYMI